MEDEFESGTEKRVGRVESVIRGEEIREQAAEISRNYDVHWQSNGNGNMAHTAWIDKFPKQRNRRTK
jgi:hypothetical protein